MGLMVIILMFVLVLDKTKGLPLVEDVVVFSMRNARNKMKILSCIFKHWVKLLMNLKTREGSRAFYQRMFGIHILQRPREGQNHLPRQYKNLRKKMFREFPRAIIEGVKEYKKLNIYKCETVAEKTKILSLTSAKDIWIEYDMHTFTGQDFRNMTSMKVWWIDWVILQFIMRVCIFSMTSLLYSLIFFFQYIDEILNLMR